MIRLLANDMSDRHGHKSNLRPFCCGTPAGDVGGGVVIGNKILAHFFFLLPFTSDTRVWCEGFVVGPVGS